MTLKEALELARDINARGEAAWESYQRDTKGKPGNRFYLRWKSDFPRHARAATWDGETFAVEFDYRVIDNFGASHDEVFSVQNREEWVKNYGNAYNYTRTY